MQVMAEARSIFVARGLDQVPVRGLALGPIAGQGEVAGVVLDYRVRRAQCIARITGPAIVRWAVHHACA